MSEITIRGAVSNSLEIKPGNTEEDVHRLCTEAFADALDRMSRHFRYHPDHPLPEDMRIKLDRHGWDVAVKVSLRYAGEGWKAEENT